VIARSGTVIDEDEMWQGIKCVRESNVIGKGGIVFTTPSPVTHVGRPQMSRTLTVAFPTRVLRWGYLSQGKRSISSKLDQTVIRLGK
jgi:hypothetical protein